VIRFVHQSGKAGTVKMAGRTASGRRVINAATAVASLTVSITLSLAVLLALPLAGTVTAPLGTTTTFADQPTRAQAAAAERADPAVGSGGVSGPWMTRSIPVRVRIPSIHVNARLVKMRTNRRGVLEPPPLNRPRLAGWYAMGTAPGEIGPAVLAGHVDSRTAPAVFYKLKTLHPGERILVDRRDGRIAVFRVQRVMQVPKRFFPARMVYGEIPYAGLRVITCGGAFDTSVGHYKDNVIVFARLERALPR
jgi:sortase (surface protein transpeptidase)